MTELIAKREREREILLREMLFKHACVTLLHSISDFLCMIVLYTFLIEHFQLHGI